MIANCSYLEKDTRVLYMQSIYSTLNLIEKGDKKTPSDLCLANVMLESLTLYIKRKLWESIQ